MDRVLFRHVPRSALVALTFCACSLTGCGGYRYTFKTGLPASDQVVSETAHQGIFGYVSGKPFNLEQACPDGVAEFGSRISFLNWIPSFLTLGLYTPRTVHAVCAQQGGNA